jgi:NADH dehydrogenase [ubiquinone] 1 alpha subcomplex assembly factor 6
MDALEAHLSKTSIPLCYLLLESLGLISLELDHVSSHVGLCVGIVTTLRGVPFRLKSNELPLPLDICAKYGLVQEQVFRQGPDAPGFKDVILEVATRSNDHLSTARQYIEDLRVKDPDLLKAGFCVFLNAVSISSCDPLTSRLFRGSI